MRALVFIVLCSLPIWGEAKYFEGESTTYPIAEPDFLHFIETKISTLEKEGVLLKMEAKIKKELSYRVEHPVPVFGITHTTADKTFYFEPTVVAQDDIRDASGKIVVSKGTSANPLSVAALKAPLLLIDGNSSDQVNWALSQNGKIILVSGAPLELMQTYDRRIYFDQGGVICKKLMITKVPTIVSQDGLRLKLEEVVIKARYAEV